MSLIDIQNITKAYPLGDELFYALKGVNLSVQEGDFLSIMGQSGSGKSTLMNIIGMLDNPTSGKYLFAGKDVSLITDDEQARIRRQAIGFIFQSYNLLRKVRVIDQVSLPLLYQGVSQKERDERAYEALKKVGLEAKALSLPNTLSGGQSQRVAIARALVTNPSIILGDEPTGALDTRTGQEIMELITSLHAEGKTIIIITHEPEVAHYARKHILIRDGNIV